MHDDKTGVAGNGGAIMPVTGRRLPDTRALAAGSRIEHLEIVDLIGAGRSGLVYMAYDGSLGAHVAVREYMPQGVATRAAGGTVQPATPQHAALYSAGLKAFASEALVLARLDSPSLVKVLRYWEGNDSGYAVMPFYDGSSLAQAVAGHRVAVNEVRLRNLIAQLLDAIEAVHRAQSCHGNISPSDILIRTDGRPLLLEFDTARAVLAELTDSRSAIVKPGFAPLEQYPEYPQLEQGAWSDIYAIGAVAYFLITGKAPQPAPERRVNDAMWPAREAGRGSYSETLLEAVDRALALMPQQRPQSAAEMRSLLGAFGPGQGFAHRSNHARDAIRADREALAAQAAAMRATSPDAAVAQAAALHAVPPPAPQAQPARQAHPLAADADIPPTAAAALRPMPRSFETPEPMQGEWRKQPVFAEHRPYPVRSKRSRPAMALAALVLFAGAGAGLLYGYQSLYSDEQTARAPETPDRQGVSPGEIPPDELDPPLAGMAEEPAGPAAGVEKPSVTPAPAAPATPAPPPVAAAPAPKPAAPPPQAVEKSKPAEKEAPDTEAEASRTAAAAEQEEWRVASMVGEPWSYENYLRRFPDGPNAAAARQHLEGLRARPAQPAAEAQASARQPAAAAPAPKTAEAVPAQEAASRGASRTIEVEGQTVSGDFNADPATGTLSGSGRVSWPNGDRYNGTLVKGSKEGKGEFVWATGQRYNGDWAKNEPNGRGTIVYANGNRYEGDVRNGLPNGRGVLVFSRGDRYDGEIRNGVPSGKGVMTFADGTRYEGELRDGLPNGQGTTRFRNGDVYVGAVVGGKSHGQGRFSWANGSIWEGEFRDGQRTGNGQLVAAGRNVASSGSSGSGQ